MNYEIIGGNEEDGFEVETSTGKIRVKNGNVLDRERQRHYSLIISAKTESATPLTGFTVATVTLLDENDSSPQFTQDSYMAAVWEGNSKGAFAIQVRRICQICKIFGNCKIFSKL